MTASSGSGTVTADGAVWRLRGDPLVGGRPEGPLAGCRVAVKDVIALRGHAIGAGDPAWLRTAPIEAAHADVVDRLLAAGADVQGITHLDPLAYSLTGSNPHYGTPVNPAAPAALTGGSSSGSAAAVARGEVELGLGTDTAGSIRVPSSYCGLYGLRPSHGAVPVRGVLPLAPSFDTVGWMAADPWVIERVSAVVLDPIEPRAVRRLLLVEELFARVEPALGVALRRTAVDLAARAGVDVASTEVGTAGRLDAWAAAFRVVQGHEAWQVHGAWVASHGDQLPPAIAARFADGSRVTSTELAAARDVIGRARGDLGRVLTPGTVLVQPAASGPPPPRGLSEDEAARTRADLLRFTAPAGLAGLPVMTVPAVSTGRGPVGLSLVGAPGSDADLIRLAVAAAVPDHPR